MELKKDVDSYIFQVYFCEVLKVRVAFFKINSLDYIHRTGFSHEKLLSGSGCWHHRCQGNAC